eukprot:GSMAST32.ASY1.ANO1.1150.1 assembled CDS
MTPNERDQRIAELEAELSRLKVSSGDVHVLQSTLGRVNKDRAVEGQVHTLQSKGKIGGDSYSGCKSPQFIAAREDVYNRVKAAYEKRLLEKPREAMTVTMPDKKTHPGTTWETTPMMIALNISKQMAKRQLVAEVRYTGKQEFELWDLNRPLEGDCDIIFHNYSQSMEREFGAVLTIGPPLKNGFYYDAFVGKDVLSKRNATTIKEKQVTKVTDNTFTTVYKNGPFIDLCMGPHVPTTSSITCMDVIKHSATYWMGDEKCDSLQRVFFLKYFSKIHGVAFPDKKEMKKWKAVMELKRMNDHRRIGPRQQLFFFHDLTPGSAFFLPHGARIYNALIDFIKNEYWQRGYDEVVTPNIFSTDLWKISGHYQHYRDDMFLFNTSDQDEFALKPMNCPGHCLMFRQQIRTFREMPIRMADFGVLHRNERSGALTGLTRVRRFQQDDAHIFCTPEQVKDEVVGSLQFMKAVYSIFGMKFKLEPVGADTPEGLKRWDDAEESLANALDEFAGKGNWKDNPGDGAFYGPKIDIKVFDCMDRIHQCATVQLDFNLPIRFDLQYRTEKKQKKKSESSSSCRAAPGFQRPVMVHRAMLGSVERMFAILTEHYGGKWPLWLSPPHYDYARSVKEKIHMAGFHVSVDLSSKQFPKKIREASLAQYNYILIVGDAEMSIKSAAVRPRGTNGQEVKTIEQIITNMKQECCDKPQQPSALLEAAKLIQKGDKNANKGKKKQKVASDPNQDSFTKIDIRVGTITKAWPNPDSEKLWCEEIDLGAEIGMRSISSGLRQFYPEVSDMEGRKVLVVANLKAAKLAGVTSEGMVLCAKLGDAVQFVEPPVGAANGERIFIEGLSGTPATKSQVKKKKLWEAMAKDLKTNDECVATWQGKPLLTTAGSCRSNLADAPIS